MWISSEDGGFEVIHECFGRVSLHLLVLDPVPGFKPKLHLFEVDEVVLAHRQPPADGVDLVFLQVARLAQAEPHFCEGDHVFALDLVYAFALALLFDHAHDLLDLVLAQAGEGFLLAHLQALDELDLLAQQQHQQADDLLIYALFDGNATVSLQTHCRYVLQGLYGRRVDEIEEAHEVHFLLIAVESKQNLDLIFGLSDAIFFQNLEDVSSGDESFSPGDVVEECEWMEIWASGDGFAVGLQHVFLLF